MDKTIQALHDTATGLQLATIIVATTALACAMVRWGKKKVSTETPAA